jgi:hypothetical protein
MVSKHANMGWLQHRTEEYCTGRRETGELVKDFDEVGKLGQGFHR